ncbi:MAG: hypothetical protein JWN65_23 [Solirubrobacterales bacterium]|nr:hypothetical protein [Solirubrobacterales bacterium]
MKQWFWTYGWKFVVAFIVFGLLLAYLVRLERQASGEAAVRTPAAGALHAAAHAWPAGARADVPTSPRA